MTIDDLIALLKKSKEVHPDIQTVQALNREGKKTSSVGVHALKSTLLIKGELT